MTINRIAFLVGAAIALAVLMANVAHAQVVYQPPLPDPPGTSRVPAVESSQPSAKETPAEWTFKQLVLPRYVAPQNGAVFHDGLVTQTSFTGSCGGKTYCVLWLSESPNKSTDLGEEIDMTLGYTNRVGHLRWLVEGIYFIEPAINDFAAVDLEVGLGWAYARGEAHRSIGDNEGEAGWSRK